MSFQLSYTCQGTGIPVLLLHGFCEKKEIWENMIPSLSKISQIFAVDFPNVEELSISDQAITIDRIAEIVYQFMVQDLKIKKAILVGHSMGGYVALALAEKYPEFCLGLCLFHSTAKADAPAKQIVRLNTAAFLEKHGTAVFAQNFVPSIFATDNHERLKEVIAQQKIMVSNVSKATAIAYTLAMKDRKERFKVLENAEFPCLFIAGEEDQAVPISDMEMQSQLPDTVSTLEIVQECGHMGMFEQTEICITALKKFISEI